MPRREDERWGLWAREALQGRHLHEPPEGAVRRAVSIAAASREDRPGAVEWLVKLLFDSSVQPLPAGVRAAASEPRRLLYEVRGRESHQLDLRLRRERAGTVELTGQLLPPAADARVVAQLGRLRRTARMSAAGEFLLRGLPGKSPSVRLEIETDGEPIVVPDVPLPPLDED